MPYPPRQRALLLTLLALLLGVVGLQLDWRRPAAHSPAPAGHGLAALYAGHRSGVWVTASGRVARVLPDDRRGDRHQRFLLRLADGQTVLVAHNIDLAPHVPLQPGSRVTVRGRYEWNERGGVLHWTHRDPRGRQAGGWIEADGHRYR